MELYIDEKLIFFRTIRYRVALPYAGLSSQDLYVMETTRWFLAMDLSNGDLLVRCTG